MPIPDPRATLDRMTATGGVPSFIDVRDDTQSPPPRWLIVVTILAVALGVFIRFFHLDSKSCWHDEAWTLTQVAGHRVRPFIREQVDRGEIVKARRLQEVQRQLEPGASVGTTIAILGSDDAQHPPLYYAIARLWAQVVGGGQTSLGDARLVAAIFGMLALPCAYWLGIELFDRRRRDVALVMVAMLALSPVHVLYAQEAREYSLWTMAILLSSAVLVVALRSGRWQWWLLYALTAALGLYSFTLFMFVQVAHAMYIAAATVGWSQRRRAVLWFVVSSIGAVVLFAPWIWQILESRQTVGSQTGWLSRGGGAVFLAKRWASAIGSLLLDLHPMHLITPATVASVLVVGVGAVAGWMRMPRGARWLTLGLMFVPLLGLALPDLLAGGVRSTQVRYWMPIYLGLGIAIAFAIADARRAWVQKAALSLVLLAGAVSYVVQDRAACWWHKGGNEEFPQLETVLRQHSRPLLIAHMQTIKAGTLLSFAHHLDPETNVYLLKGNAPPDIAPDVLSKYDAVFLFIDYACLTTPLDPDLTARLEHIDQLKMLRRIDDDGAYHSRAKPTKE